MLERGGSYTLAENGSHLPPKRSRVLGLRAPPRASPVCSLPLDLCVCAPQDSRSWPAGHPPCPLLPTEEKPCQRCWTNALSVTLDHARSRCHSRPRPASFQVYGLLTCTGWLGLPGPTHGFHWLEIIAVPERHEPCGLRAASQALQRARGSLWSRHSGGHEVSGALLTACAGSRDHGVIWTRPPEEPLGTAAAARMAEVPALSASSPGKPSSGAGGPHRRAPLGGRWR